VEPSVGKKSSARRPDVFSTPRSMRSAMAGADNCTSAPTAANAADASVEVFRLISPGVGEESDGVIAGRQRSARRDFIDENRLAVFILNRGTRDADLRVIGEHQFNFCSGICDGPQVQFGSRAGHKFHTQLAVRNQSSQRNFTCGCGA
jgi:hypothetical protein